MPAHASVDMIANFIETEFADIQQQSPWDNSGRQVYIGNMPVTKLCLALDPSRSVINQAIYRGCELLITHHPLFFQAPKSLSNADLQGSLAIKAIQNNLNILSYHTNLDKAADGLSAHIVRLLGATLEDGALDEEGFGRIGTFAEPMDANLFIIELKKQLSLRYIISNQPPMPTYGTHYAPDIQKFAVCTGSGATSWRACKQKGINMLITGDMKHHDALDAAEAGIYILDASHFATERIYMSHLASVLQAQFELEVVVAAEGTTVYFL